MKIILLSILAVAMIGLTVPSAFAYTISNDATGGDCTQIGTWDSGSKTCTLTSDISEGITIADHYITLDGNGYSIVGQNPTSDDNWDTRQNEVFGIFAEMRTNLIIKNVHVQGWYHGMFFNPIVNSEIKENTSTNNFAHQIRLYGSDNNIISNNVLPCGDVTGGGNAIGIASYFGEGNDILGNTVSGCGYKGIEVVKEPNSIVSNNVVEGLGTTDEYVLLSVNQGSHYSTITGNTVTNGNWGLEYSGSNGGYVQNNIVSNNQANGLSATGGSATVSGNLVSNNGVGLVVSGGTTVFHNNLISNSIEGTKFSGYGDLTLTDSRGNYWSDFAPNCSDSNHDNFCDEPYPLASLSGISDDYIWTVQDGWLTQITTPGNITLEADVFSTGAVGTYSSVTATHDGDTMSVTCDTSSGATFPIGTTTVLCTAQNGIKSTFDVTVTETFITPSITASAFLNSTSSTGRTLTANQGNWNDEVSANAGTTGWQVLYAITDPNGASVADSLGQAGQSMNFWFSGFDQYGYQDRWSVEIPLSWEAGTYTITSSTVGSWNEDPVGVVPYSTTVTIPILDTAPPVVTVPSNISLYEVASNVGAVGTFSVSATDEVDGAVTTTCDTASGATFPVGITTVTCTASDAAGNVGTASFTVTVVEYVPPYLVLSNVRLIDSLGNTISEAVLGQQVEIAFTITNEMSFVVDEDGYIDNDIPFAFLVSHTGPSSDLHWITGQLFTDESYDLSMGAFSNWTPQSPGDYTFTVRVTENVEDCVIDPPSSGILTVDNLDFSAQSCTTLTDPITLQLNVPLPPEATTITMAAGSGNPGCQETVQGCYIPSQASVSVASQVTFVNTDNAVHTSTFGDVGAANTGSVWNSNLLMPGSSFSIALNSSGVYPYYCMVHPWMTGAIYVGTGIPEPESQPDAELSLSLNKSEFDLDELITVGASISEISGTGDVTIEVTDPNGNQVITRMLTVGNSAAQFDFRISDRFVVGYYKISASSNISGNVITDHVFFNIKSQYDQFQIESVQVTDQQGNPSTLQRGEMAHIKVTLTSNINIEPLVTVNLFDSSLTTLGVGSIRTPINEGESEIILSFLIPDDAALGGAMIYVNAFTDWISNGGVSLTGEVSKSENISQ